MRKGGEKEWAKEYVVCTETKPQVLNKTKNFTKHFIGYVSMAMTNVV